MTPLNGTRRPQTPGALAAIFACVVGTGLAPTGPLIASPSALDKQIDTANSVRDNTDYGFRRGSLVVAPIPFSNPTIGSGLVLGAGYLFSIDPGSKPSVLGVAGLRSDNGTNGYGASFNLYFNDNRWLFESLFAAADARYDLFTSVGTLPLRQKGRLGRVSLSYGVTPQLSFGVEAGYLETDIDLDLDNLPPIPPPFDSFLSTELLDLGFVAQWDTRDDTIYPRSGFNLDIQASYGQALDSSLPDYSKGHANFTHYRSLGQSGVLAARASLCGASEEAPFFEQCWLGLTDAFRGFAATEYLGQRMASVQIEYRQRLSGRFHAVAFGGLGLVGPSWSDLHATGTHAAGGLGLRYRVSEKFPVDLSLDLARNDQSQNTVYVYVGQRF